MPSCVGSGVEVRQTDPQMSKLIRTRSAKQHTLYILEGKDSKAIILRPVRGHCKVKCDSCPRPWSAAIRRRASSQIKLDTREPKTPNNTRVIYYSRAII
jgi:hypothetical protein